MSKQQNKPSTSILGFEHKPWAAANKLRCCTTRARGWTSRALAKSSTSTLITLKTGLMQDLLTGEVRVTPVPEPAEEATA